MPFPCPWPAGRMFLDCVIITITVAARLIPSRQARQQSKGSWGAVCSQGFNAASAAVACKQMGFTSNAASPASCASVNGVNYCPDTWPTLSGVACKGSEASLVDCVFDAGDEVFCAARESVLLTCAGDVISTPRRVTIQYLVRSSQVVVMRRDERSKRSHPNSLVLDIVQV